MRVFGILAVTAVAIGLLAGMAGAATSNDLVSLTLNDQIGGSAGTARVMYAIDDHQYDAAPGPGTTWYLSDVGGQSVKLIIDHPMLGLLVAEVEVPASPKVVIDAEVSYDGQLLTKVRPARVLDGVVVSRGLGSGSLSSVGSGLSPAILGAVSDANTTYQCQSADSFEAYSSGSVSTVTWRGFYFDFGSFGDPGPGVGDSFTISYFQDNPGVGPGALHAGPFGVTATRNETGARFSAGGQMITEYEYEASHAPVDVVAGSVYWIQILNNTTGEEAWLWRTDQTNRWSVQGDGSGFHRTPQNLAFALDIESGPPSPGPVPPNDLCADAIAVAVPSVTPGSTIDATVDGAPDCGTSDTAPGVWYSVTLASSMEVTADLCNGNTFYDSKMSVFTGGCATLTCVGGNDDSCGLQSSVTWNADAGVEYLILVHGFGSSTGDFELTLTGVEPPPPFGLYDIFDCGSSFEDISATGTDLGLGDDDGTVVALGFTFTFGGVDHTDIGVGSNGYLTFGADLTDLSNDPIPTPADPNDLIAPLWDDLDPSSMGAVYTQTKGTPGFRRFIAQWDGVPEFGGVDGLTFQAVLFEGTNAIEFHYGPITAESFPGDWTAGIENSNGTEGFALDTSLLAEGQCHQLFPHRTGPFDDGDPGFVLTMQGMVELGEFFPICMQGPPDWLFALFASAGQGPTPSPWGDLYVDFPPLAVFVRNFPPSGEVCFDHPMHCDAGLLGATGYLQFIGLHPTDPSQFGRSNQAAIMVTDGSCND